MEAGEGEGETEFQTFIDVPAILDKYKAAAAVADGKNSFQYLHQPFQTLLRCPQHKVANVVFLIIFVINFFNTISFSCS